MKITDEAVEAATDAFVGAKGTLNDHITEILEAAAPHMNEPTLGDDVTIVRAIEQIDAGEQSAPSNHLMNTGLSDAVLWSEVREWLESLAGDSK